MSKNHVGDEINIGDVTTSTVIVKPKYISNRFGGFLVVVVLVAILTAIVLPIFGISGRDILSFLSPQKISTREQLLRQIWGTYKDPEGQTWVFSPNQLFNMDGTIYINGQPAMGYKVVDDSSIYLGDALSRDATPVPFAVSSRMLEIEIGEGKSFVLTRTSNNYSTLP